MHVASSFCRLRLIVQLPFIIKTSPLVLLNLQVRYFQRLQMSSPIDPEEYQDPYLRAAVSEPLRHRGTPKHHPVAFPRVQGDIVDLTGDSDDEVSHPQPSEAVDLIGDTIDDEDDENLKTAIALSMQGVNSSSPQPQLSGDFQASPTAPNTLNNAKNTSALSSNPAPTNAFGVLGLDRKRLEEERLARAAKRKADQSVSPSLIGREKKLTKHDKDLSTQDLAKPASIAPAHSSTHETHSARTTSSINTEKTATQMTPSSLQSIQFPKGVVRKTWVFGCPRKGDDIKIEEVFRQSDLEMAILSAFQWDMEWLFSKLNTKKSRFFLVMQAKEESTKRQYEMETAEMNNLRLCFPSMDGQVNCMHSKLMLLFHPTYLRVVVPGANLVPYDWGESGGVMENTVFLIDLPKKLDDKKGSSETAFYDDLVYFLRASGLHENLIAKLSSFDFSETGPYAFIHTIGGSHTGDTWQRTGHCGLGRAVAALGLRYHKPMNIDYVTSSVGSLTDEFLRSIYLASQGDDGLTEFTLRTSKTFPAKSRADPKTLVQKTAGDEWKDRFRLYFPSERTVKQSKGGPPCAGTICFQPKWYSGPKFPRHVMRDCISRREGLLMHNKMLFARPEIPINRPDGSVCKAWAYIGSANLSESAWGRLVQDRSTKEPKLNCRNWECGVLVPILQNPSPITEGGKVEAKGDSEETDIAQVFSDTVPVPMCVPGRPYGPDLKPWFYMAD